MRECRYPRLGFIFWKLPAFVWISFNHLDVQRKAKILIQRHFFFYLTLTLLPFFFLRGNDGWLNEANVQNLPVLLFRVIGGGHCRDLCHESVGFFATLPA